jgi:FixJ family two-component response regulator
MKHVVLERLDKWDEHEGWMEIVVEDRNASPADIARVRLDFAAWLKTLPRRDRRVALELARGEKTREVAQTHDLSDGRVSQLRKELHLSWELMMLS